MIATLVGLCLASAVPALPPGEPAEKVRESTRSSCVRVVAIDRDRQGSGVVVGVRGPFVYVLTAAHVVTGSAKLEVHLPPDKASKVSVLRDVDILVEADAQDVALLRAATGGSSIPAARIADSAGRGADEEFDAVSAGYGSAPEPEVRNEKVLGKKLLRRTEGTTWFAWECRGRPEAGRSGGALIDSRERVIGICSGTQDGKGYYCHLDEIRALLKKRNYAWLWHADDAK